MDFEKHDPRTEEPYMILDENGKVVDKENLPELSEDELKYLYKTMVFTRIIDERAVSYQRQGRMLTYAPNTGQEAAQVGSAYALEKRDWLVPAFRELGAWLVKEVPLKNIYLYWYGNEWGSYMPEGVNMLPVAIPIASQMQHATGIAMANNIKGEDSVAMAYVGDGGTSSGDFHESINFAAVFNAPVVFVIQNNQYAISVPRKMQTTSKTLAQKAVSYDIPGILVDGNDIFAMYAVTKQAVERAREGLGPTLIEAYTYRLGAHTTSDDPTKYRLDEEVEEFCDVEEDGSMDYAQENSWVSRNFLIIAIIALWIVSLISFVLSLSPSARVLKHTGIYILLLGACEILFVLHPDAPTSLRTGRMIEILVLVVGQLLMIAIRVTSARNAFEKLSMRVGALMLFAAIGIFIYNIGVGNFLWSVVEAIIGIILLIIVGAVVVMAIKAPPSKKRKDEGPEENKYETCGYCRYFDNGEGFCHYHRANRSSGDSCGYFKS